MWKRLDDLYLIEAYRQSGDGPEVELLAELLAGLKDEPWTSRASLTSRAGQLRLTTAPSSDRDGPHGAVCLTVKDTRVDVALLPGGADRPTEQAACSPHKARALASLWMQKLLGGYSPPRSGAAEDGDATRPTFELHERVRVLARDGLNTPRQAEIRQVLWHHKDKRWNYYLRQGDRSISKRYLAADLAADA